MSLIPSLGKANPELRDALKKLSAAKYGKPRAVVEKEIFQRLGVGDAARKAKIDAIKKIQQEKMTQMNAARIGNDEQGNVKNSSGPSFLDEWLAKRQQLQNKPIDNTSNLSQVRKEDDVLVGDELVIRQSEDKNDDEVVVKIR